GVSYANANPSISSSGCAIVLRNQTVGPFSGLSVEHVEKTVTESGNVNAKCKVDLGAAPGGHREFNIRNTGFFCFIDGTATSDWSENISAHGETTLDCHIHPPAAP